MRPGVSRVGPVSAVKNIGVLSDGREAGRGGRDLFVCADDQVSFGFQAIDNPLKGRLLQAGLIVGEEVVS